MHISYEVTIIGHCWSGYKTSLELKFNQDHKPTDGEIKDRAGDFSHVEDVRIVKRVVSYELVQEFDSEKSEEFMMEVQ